MLELLNVKKKFGKRTAVDGINLKIDKGSIFGLVGESGCGKSTTARMILCLTAPDSGEIFFDGKKISDLSGAAAKQFRKDIQVIFQDPLASLNPRMTVGEAIAEPLLANGVCGKRRALEKVKELLNAVDLPQSYLARYPSEISGGECQRACIARALSVSPKFLVLDEPVSSLDFEVQGRIIDMLVNLKESNHLTYLFITHDLFLARQICDRIAVMKDGRIIEEAKTKDIFIFPKEEYTKQLILDSI